MKIAVASGKGGTGKTTVATGLAALLAADGPVVLADLDVEEPNAQLFLTGSLLHEEEVTKSVPTWHADACTFCGLCQDVCNFGAVLALPDEVMVFDNLCHACFACSELCPTGALPMQPRPMGTLRHRREGRLDSLESRLLVGQEQAVPLIRYTLGFIDRTFPDAPLVILDAPPGTSCPVIEATRHADLVLLVTEPTPFGLHDLRLAVETMRQLERPVKVVINRHGLGDAAVEDYCAREGLEVVARIPHSRRVAELYAEGRLPATEVPALRHALREIAAALPGAGIGGAS